MRRHDLNATLIEGVLDVLVQVRIGLDHFLGLIRIDIQFIGYIKIVEGFFYSVRLPFIVGTEF